MGSEVIDDIMFLVAESPLLMDQTRVLRLILPWRVIVR
jgi:hypothetical protein